MYGKQTECAIAAMSRLAEVYDGGETRLAASEIADSRDLPRPFVAKTLSALVQAGLVIASRGPGGGCSLARDPGEITLYDVFRLFEREDTSNVCPFGGGRCGVGDACALHDKLVSVQKALDSLLLDTTFEEFRLLADQRAAERGGKGKRKSKTAKTAKTAKTRKKTAPKAKKRESYRAPRTR